MNLVEIDFVFGFVGWVGCLVGCLFGWFVCVFSTKKKYKIKYVILVRDLVLNRQLKWWQI